MSCGEHETHSGTLHVYLEGYSIAGDRLTKKAAGSQPAAARTQ
jgi:hypothetical protein